MTPALARRAYDAVTRRTFLVASAGGVASLAAANASPAKSGARAKSTILFFLCGGASHIDTWDMKPDAPDGIRGTFNPIDTSAPGVRLCEHLPLLAKQMHHVAVVRSVGASVATNDHHAGYYHNLTGHYPDPSFVTLGNDRRPRSDDWPYLGCVVGAKRSPHPQLPNAITIPYKPSRLPYTRPGQFAARLGVEHDPMYVYSTREKPQKFTAPSISLEGDVSADRLGSRHTLLRAVDDARRNFDVGARGQTWNTLQEKAVSLLMSSKAAEAFDVSREPAAVREKYGTTVNQMSLLLARRLVEAEVPFITVFWMGDDKLSDKCKSGGGWDTHGSNFECLKNHLLPEFDRGFAALTADLADRGLLDSTLLFVTSEMGRTPKIGDRRSGGIYGAGRDHWTHCMSVLLAGAGIRGGQTYGSSDKSAAYPADKRVSPADVTKTVYHAMGVHDLDFRDKEGRPYSLLEEGEAITGLWE